MRVPVTPTGRQEPEVSLQNVPVRTEVGRQLRAAWRDRQPRLDLYLAWVERRVAQRDP